MTCERAAVLGLGSRIACAEKAMVEDAHFAELGAAPATGVPRNAFSHSVRVAEKGRPDNEVIGNPLSVWDWIVVECYVRASTARANCIYIALLDYERYHLRVSCSRYVNAAREQRGRDIP